MERCLTEEQLTKIILNWLENNGWEIICFDFPQSGTGVVLHSSCRTKESKNKDSFIPDIVAIKNRRVIFFENKDRFVLSDFEKVMNLKKSSNYIDSISKLLKKYRYKKIYYGIGLPKNKNVSEKIKIHEGKTDFVIQANKKEVNVIYQIENIFK